MVPDSIESRLARVEQQLNDLSIDVRTFAPLIQDQAVLRSEMQRANADLNALAASLRQLVDRIDAEREERRKENTQRVERERKDRFVRQTTLVMLFLVFVSTLVGVITMTTP